MVPNSPRGTGPQRPQRSAALHSSGSEFGYQTGYSTIPYYSSTVLKVLKRNPATPPANPLAEVLVALPYNGLMVFISIGVSRV